MAESITFAMSTHEQIIEKWLRAAVLPTITRMDADPSRGLTVDKVRVNLSAARTVG